MHKRRGAEEAEIADCSCEGIHGCGRENREKREKEFKGEGEA